MDFYDKVNQKKLVEKQKDEEFAKRL